MAKQVIEHGVFNIKTCSECKCKFTFDTDDLESIGTVICPQCGTRNSTAYWYCRFNIAILNKNLRLFINPLN